MAPCGVRRWWSTAIFAVTAVLSGPAALAQTPTPSPQTTAPTLTTRSSRLFLGPTGRALGKGDGYFVLYGPFVPAFQIGLTDRVSIGGGTVYFADGAFWVTPKVQVARTASTGVALGLLHLVVPGEGQLGIAYVVATRETARGGWTFGAGGAYSIESGGDDDFASGAPTILIGGDRQLGRRTAFVSENYVIFGGAAILLNGIRASWGRFSLETAAMILVSEDSVFGGPFFNLVWRF